MHGDVDAAIEFLIAEEDSEDILAENKIVTFPAVDSHGNVFFLALFFSYAYKGMSELCIFSFLFLTSPSLSKKMSES